MIEHLTLESFKEKIMNFEENKEWKFEGELPAIVKYSASWCSPCKALTPILESLSKEYDGKLNIYEVDVDSEPELSSIFNIRSVPTMLFIPMIGEPKLNIGALPQPRLRAAIEDILT